MGEKMKKSFEDLAKNLGFVVPNANDGIIHVCTGIDEDELLNIIKQNEKIFNKDVMNHLYSLYNLEFSALNAKNNPSNIQENLYMHSFYKKLVSYNILNRCYELLKITKIEKIIKKNSNSLNLSFINNEYIDKLFTLETNFIHSNLYFYKPQVISIREQEELNNEEILNVNKRLENLERKIERLKHYNSNIIEEEMKNSLIDEEDYSYPIYGPTDFNYDELDIERTNLIKRLEELKKLNRNVFEQRYKNARGSENLMNEIQDILFDDFGINLENDFSFQSKLDEKHLVKKYPIATIHYFK